MDDLPKQQQEIVEVIALSWSAVNVKEIRQKTRMESKMISDQLTHLVKNGIINRILTTTKNHLYQLNDRFFNIWYLMRYGRKGHKKEVILLVRFFELWCEKKEVIVERVQKQINQLKSGNFEEAEKKIINAIEIAKNKETEIEAHLDGLIGVFLFLLQRRKYKELLAFFHDEKIYCFFAVGWNRGLD